MKNQKEIKTVIKRIVRDYQPEKIYLFGFFAWGKPTQDSDVDLLIVKRTEEDFLQRHFRVRRIIDGEIAADILIQTPRELKRRLNLGDFFYRDIVKKGKCLYEKRKK